MSNVTKDDLIHVVSSKSKVSYPETKRVLEATFEVIPDILKDGRQIQLRGFGTFKMVHRKEKTGRNMQTGGKVVIPARDVPVFKFAK